MSGPSRELPPLSIKILGDASGARRAYAEALAGARALASQLAATSAQGSMAAAQRAVRDCTRAAMAAVVRNVQQITNNIGNINVGGARVTATVRYAVRMINEFIRLYIAQMVNGIGNVRVNASGINAALRRAMRSINQFIRNYLIQVSASLATITVNNGGMNAAMRRSIRVAMRALAQAIATAMTTASGLVAGQVLYVGMARASLQRTMRTVMQVMLAAIHASLLAGAAGANAAAIANMVNAALRRMFRQYLAGLNNNPGNRPPHRSPRDSGSGSGSAMGARADMFMHAGAIKNIVGMAASFIEPAAALEQYTTQIKVFTRSAEKANEVIARMQEYALVSPYSLESVLNATSKLMITGQSDKQASEMVTMLGDIAGGDSERLKYLAKAVSDTYSIGRLKGTELVQFNNALFNPLNVAAKHMLPNGTPAEIQAKQAELESKMRKGGISYGFVENAIRLSTSKGGSHAGMVQEQSKTTKGLATQIRESLDLASIAVTNMFDEEIKKLLKDTLRIVTAFLAWVKANKALVRQVGELVVKIGMAAVAFHALSLVIATSRWMLGSLITMFNLLTAASRRSAIAMVGAWVAGIGPIGWLIIGIGALTTAVYGLTHENGIRGMFDDLKIFGKGLVGFFWNFSKNLPNLFKFIEANWRLMLTNMITATVEALTTLWSMFNKWRIATGTQIGEVAHSWSVLIDKGDKNTQQKRKDRVAAGQSGDYAGIMTLIERIASNAGWMLGIDDGYGNAIIDPKTGKPAGEGKSLWDLIASPVTGTNGMGAIDPKTGKPKIDTSMLDLKFDLTGFLKDFMAPDRQFKIPDAPNVNFDEFLSPEKEKDKKKRKGKQPDPSRDHAMYNSAEHAQRLWEYDVAMRGGGEAVTAANAPMKQVALLEQIARNTQPDDSRGDMLEDVDID